MIIIFNEFKDLIQNYVGSHEPEKHLVSDTPGLRWIIPMFWSYEMITLNVTSIMSRLAPSSTLDEHSRGKYRSTPVTTNSVITKSSL